MALNLALMYNIWSYLISNLDHDFWFKNVEIFGKKHNIHPSRGIESSQSVLAPSPRDLQDPPSHSPPVVHLTQRGAPDIRPLHKPEFWLNFLHTLIATKCSLIAPKELYT